MNDIEEYIKRLEKRIKDTEDYNTNQVWLTDDVYAVKKVINRVKELEEELDRQINAREIEEKYVEENFITRSEKDACEMILEKAGLKRKFDIVDKTKDKRFKELEEMLEKLLKEKE